MALPSPTSRYWAPQHIKIHTCTSDYPLPKDMQLDATRRVWASVAENFNEFWECHSWNLWHYSVAQEQRSPPVRGKVPTINPHFKRQSPVTAINMDNTPYRYGWCTIETKPKQRMAEKLLSIK